jgi:hypothetical protein
MKNIFKLKAARRLATIALLAIIAFLTAACAPEIPVSGITMDRQTAIVPVGGKVTLKAIITPGDATNQKVSWDSFDHNTATVSSSGEVTGKAVGEVYIIATADDGGKTASCVVTVIPGSGGGDNDGSLGATLSISNLQVYTVESGNDDYIYTPFNGTVTGLNYVTVWNENDERENLPLNDVFDGARTVTLTNGKLSINLGTPKTFALISLNDSGMPPEITISNTDAKAFMLQEIRNNYNQVIQSNDTGYLYVDRDVKISGTFKYESYYGTVEYIVYDWNLKTGWNSIIRIVTKSDDGKVTTNTTKTGKPTGNEKWIYSSGGGSGVDWANTAFTVVIENDNLDYGGYLYAQLKVGNNYYYPDDEGFTLQWYRDGVAISGETSYNYYPEDSDAGKALTVRVRGYGRNETSAPYNVPVVSGGTFTLSGIPSKYNGKYAYLQAYNEISEDWVLGIENLSGSASSQRITMSRITNGSVSFPMWKEVSYNEYLVIGRYSGNDYFDAIEVNIFDSQTLYIDQDNGNYPIGGWEYSSSVYFSNGSASRSWSQGEEIIIGGKQTPSASNYILIGSTQFYDGTPKYVEITRKAGEGSSGMITIYYDGSTTAPSAVGVYSITIDVAETSTWNAAYGLSIGLLTIYPNDGGPSAPTNVTATRSSTPTTVNISWSNVSGASYYEVYSSLSTDGSIYYEGYTYSTSFASTGNRTDAAVYFKVYAVNSADERSGPSELASVPLVSFGGNDGFLGATLALSGMRVYMDDWSDQIGYFYTPFEDSIYDLNYISIYNSNDEEPDVFPLNEVFYGYNNVTLTNGNLSLNLGTPKDIALRSFSDDDYPSGITISNSAAKYFELSRITRESGYGNIQSDDVIYMYADRDVTISGSQSNNYGGDYTFTYVYAVNLKAGWNSIITVVNYESENSLEVTMKTGMITGIEKWTYYNRW